MCLVLSCNHTSPAILLLIIIESLLYISGLPHHKVATDKMIEEVVNLVEAKSKEMKNNKVKL